MFSQGQVEFFNTHSWLHVAVGHQSNEGTTTINGMVQHPLPGSAFKQIKHSTNLYTHCNTSSDKGIKHCYTVDEVKLAVAPCGSSEKNCWGWEGVSVIRCCDGHPNHHRGRSVVERIRISTSISKRSWVRIPPVSPVKFFHRHSESAEYAVLYTRWCRAKLNHLFITRRKNLINL